MIPRPVKLPAYASDILIKDKTLKSDSYVPNH